MNYILALLLVIIALTEATMQANLQNITAKGTAICEKHRTHNVLVELWEKDTISNDLLASVYTNVEGNFFLTGGDSEITAISPYIKFKHTCKATVKKDHQCTRKTKYTVPAQFIYKEEKERKEYDMSYVSLDIYGDDDEEHCEKKN